jgi:hypothetical protein
MGSQLVGTRVHRAVSIEKPVARIVERLLVWRGGSKFAVHTGAGSTLTPKCAWPCRLATFLATTASSGYWARAGSGRSARAADQEGNGCAFTSQASTLA